MTARHFTISHGTMLSAGAGWYIAETEGPSGKLIEEFPQNHTQRDAALASLAYSIVGKTLGPIIVYINEK